MYFIDELRCAFYAFYGQKNKISFVHKIFVNFTGKKQLKKTHREHTVFDPCVLFTVVV